MNKAVSILIMLGILVAGVGSIFAATWWALHKVREVQREAAAEEVAAAEAATKTEPLAPPPSPQPTEPEPAPAPQPAPAPTPEPAAAEPAPPPQPEELVDAHCKGAPLEQLNLEVQFLEPSLTALHLEEYRVGLPAGKVP